MVNSEVKKLFCSKYVRVTTYHPFGPVTLTIFSPVDAEWIERIIHEIPADLHTVQSAIATVGNSIIVLERESDLFDLHFSAQCYRPLSEPADEPHEIQVDILSSYPTT